MATTFMNLELPVVSVTLGPEWANEVNAAFETIDEHDHSSGKGTKIKPTGLDINTDLDLQSNRIFALKSTKYNDQTVTLTGASNSNSIFTNNGNLYFTNGSGTAVQITSGGAVVSVPGAVDSFQFNNFTSDVSIAPVDNYVFLSMDTTAARVVTLPLASSVSSGRIYVIKDASGLAETNNITVSCSGSDNLDGAASQIMNSNYSTLYVIGNGVDKWFIL